MASSSPEVLEAAPLVSELLVTGMTCANCAQHVTQALLSVPGVDSAEVSLKEGRAHVRWKAGSEGKVASLMSAVAGAGYAAKPVMAGNEPKKAAILAGWRFNVVIGVACTLPLMAGEWLFDWGQKTWFVWLSFVLALVVQVGC